MRLISGREIGSGLGKILHVKYEAMKTNSTVLLHVDVLYNVALIDLRDAPLTIKMPEKEPLPSNQKAQFLSEGIPGMKLA